MHFVFIFKYYQLISEKYNTVVSAFDKDLSGEFNVSKNYFYLLFAQLLFE